MLLELSLVFLLYCTGVSGCECTDDGKTINCIDDENVIPSSLAFICPKSENVVSISLGFSIFCYSEALSVFPNLRTFYVAGGDGANCLCYVDVLCHVSVAKCDCVETTTQVSTASFTMVSTVPPTTVGTKTGSKGTVVIMVVILVSIVVLFGVIAFVGYRIYLKQPLVMQNQIDHLIGTSDDSRRSSNDSSAAVIHGSVVDVEGIDHPATSKSVGPNPPAGAVLLDAAGTNPPAASLKLEVETAGINPLAESAVAGVSNVSDNEVKPDISPIVGKGGRRVPIQSPYITRQTNENVLVRTPVGVDNAAFKIVAESGQKLMGGGIGDTGDRYQQLGCALVTLKRVKKCLLRMNTQMIMLPIKIWMKRTLKSRKKCEPS